MLFKGKKTLLAGLLAGALAGGGSYTALADEATKEYIEILVDGAGLDKESAMNNAYQNAVKQAVGLYIDAETLIDNNQEVKDKILTHSRGIIDKVEVISDQNDDGIYRVEILAQVIKQELEEKVKPISSDKTSFNIDGESLVATKISKEQQEADAKAILEEIESYIMKESINWLDFSIDGETRLSDNNDYIEVDVLINNNFDNYLKGIKKPLEMLDQIAISKKEIISTLPPEYKTANSANIRTRKDFSIPFDSITNIKPGIAIEVWRSQNYNQRKWIYYELPVDCSLKKSSSSFNIKKEVISNSDKTPIALNFAKVNHSPKIQNSYYGKFCFVSHDLLRYGGSDFIEVTKKPIKMTIKTPVDLDQISDIGSVEISVN